MRPLLLALLLLSSLSARAAGNGEPVAAKVIPAELKPFIEPRTVLLSFDAADLNGDGLSDYVLVLEKQKNKPTDDDITDGQRPLLLLIRQPNGTLKLAKRNDKLVMCSTCGGVMGDPFEAMVVGSKTFTVSHFGGSGWRWANSARFNYSRRDDTWQLVRVEEVSFHAGDPDKTTKTKVYTPPKHFGKIDIADFDPESFRGQGAK